MRSYMIHSRVTLILHNINLTKGRVEYSKQKISIRLIIHLIISARFYLTDTTSLYVTGLAAANAGAISDPKYYPYAINSYSNSCWLPLIQKMLTFILDLSSIYLSSKDTANAFKVTAGDGVAKISMQIITLRRREIEIGLQIR